MVVLFLAGMLLPGACRGPSPGFVGGAAAAISLAGSWNVRIDEADEGLDAGWFRDELRTDDAVALPGSLAQGGLGHRFDPATGRYDGLAPPYVKWPAAGYTDAHRRDDLGALVATHMTYGPAWFERTVAVPASFAGRPARLVLERVKWTSRVWVDGRPVAGGGADSLHAPHVHELGLLSPGPHRLTLRIDNRPALPIGFAGHGYGMETEPLWLGVAGELALVALDPVRVEHAEVTPAADRRAVRVALELARDAGAPDEVEVAVEVVDRGDGQVIGGARQRLAAAADGALAFDVPLGIEAAAWSEFTPRLYAVRWTIHVGDEELHRGARRVGFRTLRRDGRRILANGQPLFLRGNLDCAIHPDSHAPPTDRQWWHRVLSIHREAGFNHVRFHTWCPPEAAFAVADELGLYLQVETAYWVDDWIHRTEPFPPALGQDAAVDAWVEAEALRILRAYGHHPSFALLCLGNEFGRSQSDWGAIGRLVAELNAVTDHVLVSGTTARKTTPADEYWVTHHSGASTRGVGPAHTAWDFAAAVQATDKPVISHETGQRPSWPDYDALLSRFTDVMQPFNLRRLRERAEAAGCVDHGRRAGASARFALLQYKSEHEAMRRTAGLAGYQLLMLHDFTGQGEAHVGLLDPFFVEKPGVTLAAIRRWNGPTVPLARFASYTWTSDQVLRADLQVAHEGPAALRSVTPRWRLLTADGRVVARGELAARDVPDRALTDLGAIAVPLDGLREPTALRLRLTVGQAENQWNLWVYPPAGRGEDPPGGVHVVRRLDADALARLERGESVVVLPHGTTLPAARRLGWSSTYWTGAWGRGNGLGLLLAPAHPALGGFPTEAHSDWQWHELVQGGLGLLLSPAQADAGAIVEVLADFHHPAREACVFEARVGKGRMLVCGFDLATDLDRRHAARALRRSLLAYAGSDRFDPGLALTADEARELLSAVELGASGVVAIEADSAQPGHGPENVLDGDPATIWHTPWGAVEPPYPHYLILDLGTERRVSGLHLLPRRDGRNGRIAELAVRTSADGVEWGEPVHLQRLPDGEAIHTVRFAPRATRFLKVEARAEVAGRPWASLAELVVIDGGA